MDAISFPTLFGMLSSFGPFGVVVLIWYVDMKRTYQILESYKSDILEMRQMYKNNVHLVESYESLAKDLHDVVILNTQKWAETSEKIDQNEYCPFERLKKKTVEVKDDG